MRFVIFTHSLVSDWNHGNAHFLRGFASELVRRRHEVRILEPIDGWSRANLLRDTGEKPIHDFHNFYPLIRSTSYDERALDLSSVLNNPDVVIVHEWNSHELVRRIGEYHKRHASWRLYFHDTHHRSSTDREAMAAYDLSGYDGVLAYGSVIRDLYRVHGWVAGAWTWHEAADTHVFKPLDRGNEGDLVWIGNAGDDERTEELQEFLIRPVRALKLRAKVYGVRYPENVLHELSSAGIEYGGWLPNYLVPEVFARYRVTVHIPRRPYTRALPGIPTIRPFEALACGIPLISAPWDDCEHLFQPGRDFLFARDGSEMTTQLRRILSDSRLGSDLMLHGIETIRARHTCAHRVNELMAITGSRVMAAVEN